MAQQPAEPRVSLDRRKINARTEVVMYIDKLVQTASNGDIIGDPEFASTFPTIIRIPTTTETHHPSDQMPLHPDEIATLLIDSDTRLLDRKKGTSTISSRSRLCRPSYS
jgi:hypothetical protein